MERSNYQWVNDLQQNGPTRLQAIADLLKNLECGIHYYLSHERSDLVGRSGNELRQIAQNFAEASLVNVLDNLALFRGTSKFMTWAAKFAARVSTTGLNTTCSMQSASDRLNPIVSYWPPKRKNTLRIEEDALERIGVWEDDGGRIPDNRQSA